MQRTRLLSDETETSASLFVHLFVLRVNNPARELDFLVFQKLVNFDFVAQGIVNVPVAVSHRKHD